jgi:predicted dehydrogenase
MASMRRRTFFERAGRATGLGLSAALWARRASGAADRIRIGCIGLGSRGMTLLRSVVKVDGVEVARLCDGYTPALDKALAEIARLGPAGATPVAGNTEWREIMEDRSLDAVMIATPDYLHAPMALAAIGAGKAVYCEKPIANTIRESFDLVKAVAASKVVFQCGFQRRYNPQYRAAKRMIDEGAIGEITFIRAQWHLFDSFRRPVGPGADDRQINWQLYREFSTGLPGTFGSHQIDVANWFLGAVPEAVVGAGGIDWFRDGREIEDNISVTYTYPGGAKLAFSSIVTNGLDSHYELFLGTQGAIETSLVSGGYRYAGWTCKGCYRADLQRREEATAIIPGSVDHRACGTDSVLYTSLRGEELSRIPAPPPAPETLESLQSFIACCRTGARPDADVTGGCNAGVAAIMANMAVREGRVVRWSEVAGT